MSAGDGPGDPGDVGTSVPDDGGGHPGMHPHQRGGARQQPEDRRDATGEAADPQQRPTEPQQHPAGPRTTAGNRRLLIPLGVLAVPVAAVVVVLLLTDALGGRGIPLWLIALLVTVVGVAVLFGGYAAMRRFAGRREEDRRAGFRTGVRAWAGAHGWQVRDGGLRDGRMLPPDLLPQALEPVRVEQIITGNRRSRAVRMESWSVDIRPSGSAAATHRVGHLIRIQARGDLPLLAVSEDRSSGAAEDRSSGAATAGSTISAISPPALATYRGRRSGGLIYIGEPGHIEQVVDTLSTFAADIRRTGAWVLLRPGAVNLFFTTEPDVAVLQVRIDMGVAMAEDLDQVAEPGESH